MENAVAIANYFVKKSLESRTPITPMQLTKLAYIAHGWHLGLTGEPLLSEQAQAWQRGPVLNSIYHSFKLYGRAAITALFMLRGATIPTLPSAGVTEFLDSVWDDYSIYPGEQLSNMTHLPDTPWYDAWHNKGGMNMKNVPIDNSIIKMYYRDLVSRRPRPGIVNAIPLLDFARTALNRLEDSWVEKKDFFAGVSRTEVMHRGRILLANLQGLSPNHLIATLTQDCALYMRAELSDGTSLHIEVLFALENGADEDTMLALYEGKHEIWSEDCSFAQVGNALERRPNYSLA